MDTGFWVERWQKGEIGFHQDRVHPLLKACLPELALSPDAHVLVPLCGKSLDIGFLMAQEFRVTGVELSELAVAQLFESLALTPVVMSWSAGQCWRAQQLTVFCGDLFELHAADVGAVDAVYDRAALVAMPATLRDRYASHLVELSYAAPQLLVAFEYVQKNMAGPPFSVMPEELLALYGDVYALNLLRRQNIIEDEPRFRERGLDELVEVAWHLQPTAGR